MNKVFVISDLHLCPNRRFGNFTDATGRKLVDWTRQRLEEGPQESAIVLAGDIVDFLLVEDRPPTLDLRNARLFVRNVLQELNREFEWITPWRVALTAFGEAGGQILLLPGNHDPEWLHPDAAEEFGEWLAPGVSRPWLAVCRDSDSWKTQVGSREVKVLHGHRHDPVNDIDRDAVFEALKQGSDSFPLPWGSQFVVGPLRHFKQAMDPVTGTRRFAFLDAIKPETRGILFLLLALDPQLVVRHLPAALSGFTQFFVKHLVQQLNSGTILLGPDSTRLSEDTSSSLLANEFAQEFAASLSESDRRSSTILTNNVEDYLLNPQSTKPQISNTLGLSNAIGRYFFRAWLNQERTKAGSTQFFDTSRRDATDDLILHAHLGDHVSNRVVVAGHTHAAREIHLPNQRTYLNTGTWTNLMDLSSVKDVADLQRLLVELETAKAPTFTRLTWAEITPESASLCQVPVAL